MVNQTQFVFGEDNSVDIYAGIPVKDYPKALKWYEKLFGCPPTFVASDTEAVWDLGQHASVFIEYHEKKAGHAIHSIFLSDLDGFIAGVTKRGIEPSKREKYSNGVRKVNYTDPDGNEIGFGAGPNS